MCWLIYHIGKRYEVGYYMPTSMGGYTWYVYEAFTEQEDAEDLCNYLNGGAN